MTNVDAVHRRSQRRILQITTKPFPPAIRVVKEAVSLQDAGFSSAVLCPPIAGRPAREEWRGVQIFRPDSLASSRRMLDRLLMQSSLFSPSWYRALKETIGVYKPDVLHIHDIWLGRSAFAARDDQRMVLDLHENMPAAVVEYAKAYRGFLKWFHAVFTRHNRVIRYERTLLHRCDRVLAVVHEARERVLQDHPQLPPDEVVNIENLESKEFLSAATSDHAVFDSENFSILYIGGFGPHRGIDTLIRAMAIIKRWNLKIRLHLVGAKKGHYLNLLKELIHSQEVSEYVLLSEWVPADQVLTYISQADVGAVPHHSNPHTDSTIPHKLYQYMIARTPVLVSTSPPLARTVKQANAGRIFRAGDPAHCAETIRDMFNSRNSLKEYAHNGYRYVMEQGHNWEEESAPELIRVYDDMFGISPNPSSCFE